jgi:uncharacterized repeat protein (TIGR01451 family)
MTPTTQIPPRPAMTLPALPKTITVVLLALALALLALASAAHAAGPVLSVSVTHSPETFQRGDTADTYQLVLTNTGDAPTTGPITITDTLPPAIEAQKPTSADETNVHCEAVARPTCTTNLSIAPAESLSIGILVSTTVDAPATVTSTVTVSGGGAPEVTAGDAAPVVDRPAFAVEDFNAHALDEAGHDYTPAGGHPSEATASFSFPTFLSSSVLGNHVSPVEDLKDVFTELPPGFLGNAAAAPRCTETQLAAPGFGPQCPSGSRVGVLTLTTYGNPAAVALFNMVPEKGFPAEFGFRAGINTPVIVYTRLRPRTGGYGVTVSTPGATRLGITGIGVTFWGVPSLRNGSGGPGIPFLINPVNCQDAEPTTTNIVDSWENPARELAAPNFGTPDLTDPLWKTATFVSPAVTECDNPALASQFKPSIDVEPVQSSPIIQADQPSGLKVDLDFLQTNDPTDLHTIFNSALPQSPELKDATVTLPAGMSISPSAAAGMGACSDQSSDAAGDQVRYDNTEPVSCPDNSKIGTISATSPLLTSRDPVTDAVTGAEPIGGDVYVLKPHPGDLPPGGQGGTFRILIQAESAKNGINVKLPGTAVANPTTGQLNATFTENPQLPVKHLEVDFKAGPRAPLATPVTCGTFTTTTDLVPWSTPGTPDATPSSAFQVSSGANGQPCASAPQQRPFAPSMSGGTESTQAGASSPFVLHLTRNDGEQELTGVNLTMPPGFAAKLSGIPYCSEAAIAGASGKTGAQEQSSPSCPLASQIGTLTTSAGPGSNPYSVNGTAYLAGPYKGAPLSVVFITPAVAGPFDLGSVVVRAGVFINPTTAQVTVKTDPIPQIIDGVPLRLRSIVARIDRPAFTINPTSCNSMNLTGEAVSSSGSTAALSSHFQVGGCAALKFAPKFTASTIGQSSKANGASLTTKITYPYAGNGAVNLTRVKVQLPKQLPSRLTTLQKACTAAQFEANPAGCPPESIIGHATVNTPLLPVPLTGPAYFVSHGGEAFPSVELVLQGDNITVTLVGTTLIKGGITSTTFKTVPDVPFTTFELTLPQGKFSALGANLPEKAKYNFCAQHMVMPTELIAQNGAAIHQNTKIATTGCKAPMTNAQKLAAALKACKKKHKAKRAACARAARRQFATAARRAHRHH